MRGADIVQAEIPDLDDVPLIVVFVRHGEADTSQLELPLGPPLTRRGRLQARRVAKRLSTERFSRIYTSDLTRAHETAKAICEFHAETPCIVNKDLREVTHYHFMPGAVSAKSDVYKGVSLERKILKSFAAMIRHIHVPGERILLVCHGNFIRSVIPILSKRDPKRSMLMDVSNTAVSILEAWPSGEGVIRLANCVRHLPPSQIT